MKLNEYAEAVSLYAPFKRPDIYSDPEEYISALDREISFLSNNKDKSNTVYRSLDEKRQILRAVLNQRSAEKIPSEESRLLDRILWTERVENGIVESKNISNVWKGNITRLKVDAVVNAANSDLLGCFHPLHACIDNAIHSAAGPQLREDCNTIIKLQGTKEKTAKAKITRAYNLPAKYVLHTVGPIVKDNLTDRHKTLLKSCYSSCLDLASQTEDIKSIAFCCISTGVFGYPKEEAAVTALETVHNWTEKNPGKMDRIIFNVFTEEDYEIYQRHI